MPISIGVVLESDWEGFGGNWHVIPAPDVIRTRNRMVIDVGLGQSVGNCVKCLEVTAEGGGGVDGLLLDYTSENSK